MAIEVLYFLHSDGWTDMAPRGHSMVRKLLKSLDMICNEK